MLCMCEVASSLRLIIGASSLRAEEAACLSHLDDCPGLESQREDTAHLIKDKVLLTEGHLSPFFPPLSPGTGADVWTETEECKQPHSSRKQAPESSGKSRSFNSALLCTFFLKFKHIKKAVTLVMICDSSHQLENFCFLLCGRME